MLKRKFEFSSRFRILKGGKISLVVAALIGATTLTFAAPSGGVVTSGSATINQNGTVTNINQSTNKASINWNSFSIASNETVNFNQPNASSITLNRVVGNETSVINGALNANGQVWILNSNGVLFGKNASINTSGLLATTKNISDANFQSGNYTFSGESTASVINQGTIEVANSGSVILAANEVRNSGTIKAIKGDVHLVGANEYSINLNGNSLVNLKVEKGVLDALVENSGTIIADGGTIYLTTNAVNELLNGVLNNTGMIQANSLDDLNSHVELFAHGGEVQVGGSITALDGFVETSGKEFKIFDGAEIQAGEWLIDPVDITIDAALAGAIETALASGDVTIETDQSDYSDVDTSASGTNSESGTDGDIFVTSNITYTGVTTSTLTLSAARDIVMSDGVGITATNVALNVNLLADSDANNAGDVKLLGNNTISTMLGDVRMEGENIIFAGNNSGIITDDGSVSRPTGGSVYITGDTLDLSGLTILDLYPVNSTDGVGALTLNTNESFTISSDTTLSNTSVLTPAQMVTFTQNSVLTLNTPGNITVSEDILSDFGLDPLLTFNADGDVIMNGVLDINKPLTVNANNFTQNAAINVSNFTLNASNVIHNDSITTKDFIVTADSYTQNSGATLQASGTFRLISDAAILNGAQNSLAANYIFIYPKTDSTKISLGGTQRNPGELHLLQSDIDTLFAQSYDLHIGQYTNTGGLEVVGDIDMTKFSSWVYLEQYGDVAINGALIGGDYISIMANAININAPVSSSAFINFYVGNQLIESQTGGLTTDILNLYGGGASFSMNQGTNNVVELGELGTDTNFLSSLNYLNQGALGINQLYVYNSTEIATVVGDISFYGEVILGPGTHVFNAGKSKSAGEISGGNIYIVEAGEDPIGFYLHPEAKVKLLGGVETPEHQYIDSYLYGGTYEGSKYNSDELSDLSDLSQNGLYFVYRDPGAMNYTLSDKTSAYNGSLQSLSDFYTSSSIFGANFSSWVAGTDYKFTYGGNDVTGFTDVDTYNNILVEILKNGYTLAGAGNTAGNFTITQYVAPTPTPTPEPTEDVEDIITPIVNQMNTNVVVPKVKVSTVQNNINTNLPLGNGQEAPVVARPELGENTQLITLSQLLQSSKKGVIRVPVGDNSLLMMVNSGVRLPFGIDQEFYVVDEKK